QSATPVANPLALTASRPISAYPLGSPPLAGFTPQVVVGLTNEQNHSDTVEGFGVKSSFPGAVTLPGFGPQLFVVATLDAGSQGHIFTDAAAQGFNFASVNRDGTEVQE